MTLTTQEDEAIMNYYIKRIWKPGIFQGHGKKSGYFEGWYFKLVDREGYNVLAVIPGVSITGDREKDHCFIQLLEGKSCEAHYFKYDIEDFNYSTDTFQIRVGESSFSDKGIRLNLNSNGKKIKGEIDFGTLKPWPVRPVSPGCMGWFGLLPFMECYHGVLSFNHTLKGTIQFDDKCINFNEGKGYMEKDWGISFPSSWFWLQSNHFQRVSTSLIISAANIPWGRHSFTGFLGGLMVDNTLYRFATYTGAAMDFLEAGADHASLTLSDKRYILEVSAKNSKTGVLQSPVKGHMAGKVNESLSAEVKIRLYKRSTRGNCVLYEDFGVNGGMEISRWTV